jgi:hypothetical protein
LRESGDVETITQELAVVSTMKLGKRVRTIKFVMLNRQSCRWEKNLNSGITVIIFLVLLLNAGAVAQKPVAELPRVKVDTTWSQPTGGKSWKAHNAEEFTNSLTKSAPGDVIVLDAGVIYSGNFIMPAKSNPNKKWIYVTSSAYDQLPPPGTRVSPSNAVNMPKIVTPNVGQALRFQDGANYWRFVGVEIYSASTFHPGTNPAGTYFGYMLVDKSCYPNYKDCTSTSNIPDHIFFDRCYVHGDPTHDLQAALVLNFTYGAVLDSYISDIHAKGMDTQAVVGYVTPGPIKLANNHLEAAGENVMFGGAGRGMFDYVPSDIEVRNNYLYKPLDWVPLSRSGVMVVKNAFELKSARRVLFDSNTIENVWAAGQFGAAFLLTIRSSQSGDVAVVEDVTVTNNVFKNVVMGFNTLATDNMCGTASYPNCRNAGSSARWDIENNLVTLYDSSLQGGIGAHTGLMVFSTGRDIPNGGQFTFLHDVVLQHNTVVPNSAQLCWQAIYFNVPSGFKAPFPRSITDNIWILDNVLCRQPTGDWGRQGSAGLAEYMGAPSTPPNDLAQRFRGNIMYVPQGEKEQSFPPHNRTTTKPFRYVDPSRGNFQLLDPQWTDTTDGRMPGIDYAKLPK